jgi:hypothetical protein
VLRGLGETRNVYILVSHERRDHFGKTGEDGMILNRILENRLTSLRIGFIDRISWILL